MTRPEYKELLLEEWSLWREKERERIYGTWFNISKLTGCDCVYTSSCTQAQVCGGQKQTLGV